mgnify:CR=1 FL=1
MNRNAIREAAYRVVEAAFVAAMTAGVFVGTWWPLWAALVPVSLVVIGVRGYRWRVGLDLTWDRWQEALAAKRKARFEHEDRARAWEAETIADLEAVLAMPSWSPQAREGIRACISQLKHGDHTAHLAEARAKLGIAERDVKSSKASSKSKGGES